MRYWWASRMRAGLEELIMWFLKPFFFLGRLHPHLLCMQQWKKCIYIPAALWLYLYLSLQARTAIHTHACTLLSQTLMQDLTGQFAGGSQARLLVLMLENNMALWHCVIYLAEVQKCFIFIFNNSLQIMNTLRGLKNKITLHAPWYSSTLEVNFFLKKGASKNIIPPH